MSDAFEEATARPLGAQQTPRIEPQAGGKVTMRPVDAVAPAVRVYLDHNGSTPTTPDVASEIRGFLERAWGNAGAAHPDGQYAKLAIEKARRRVMGALGASGGDHLVFTSGGTESNNLAVLGLAEAELERERGSAGAAKARRHIVCGTHEHFSVIRAVEVLERRGFRVTWIHPAPSGAIDLGEFSSAIEDDTLLACLMFANNETGILQPVADAARIAHDKGALLLCDAVCGVGKEPVEVRALGCDLLSVSGHKLHAPKGIGALWIRAGVELSLIHI